MKEKELALKILDYWILLESLDQKSVPGMEELKRNRIEPYVMSFEYGPGRNITGILNDLKTWSSDLLKSLETKENDPDNNNAEDEKNKEDENSKNNELYFLMGGVYRNECVKVLEKLVSEKRIDVSYGANDMIAWYSFRTDIQGQYIAGSFQLSPILWAFSEWKTSDHRNFMPDRGRYDETVNNIENNLIKMSNNAAGGNAVINDNTGETDTTGKIIHRLHKEIYDRFVAPVFSLGGEKDRNTLFDDAQISFNCLCGLETGNNGVSGALSITDSFYLQDLAMIREAIQNGDFGKGNDYQKTVMEYICSAYKKSYDNSADKTRINISPSMPASYMLKFFSNILDPVCFPLGKWPSKFSPALMQQTAVNIAINEKRSPCIFSVNGPPGTGKTTLLKEIVAHNIVKRAELLCRYEDPDNAFTEHSYAGRYKYMPKYYGFSDDRINNYGMLVCSCNNAAVENITIDLPKKSDLLGGLKAGENETGAQELNEVRRLFSAEETGYAIPDHKERPDKDPEIRKDIFFDHLAGDLLDMDAWGIISAPLGKMKNIRSYCFYVLRPFINTYRKAELRDLFLKEYINTVKIFGDQLALVKRLAAQLSGGAGGSDVKPVDNNFIEEYRSDDMDTATAAQTGRIAVSVQFDREREKLFNYAVRLHKCFVCASKSFQMNMQGLLSVWTNSGDADMTSEDIKNAFPLLFQTLFLLTPVISSTFASVQRMFRNISTPGVIGTLIVDESGQAPPHMAMGALFRSRKAVIVGDPKQIEPVVTDEVDMFRSLFRSDIIEPYKDKSVSVQTFADHLNPFGTYLGTDTEREWVGCPLVVHRRCIDPMYSISNCISYDNTMKQQTRRPDEKAEEGFILRNSCWIDVTGKEVGNKDHFVEKQAEAVYSLLKYKFDRCGDKPPKLFIISPFKSVSGGIRNYLNKKFADNKLYRQWAAGTSIGTVHTFQGQGTDEVIFLLGCDSTSAGAAMWVNKNIVNVAVTRAKYRVYVIGDRNVWTKDIFNTMLEKIEEYGNVFPAEELPLNFTDAAEEYYTCPKCGGIVIKDADNRYVCRDHCSMVLGKALGEPLKDEETAALLQGKCVK